MLNNIWKGSYILFMYFFRSFFNDLFICVNKIETKLTFIPPPKNTPSSHVPEIFSFSKENLEARKKMKMAHWKQPTGNSIWKQQKRRKTAHLKTSARPIDTNVRWIPNLVTCGGLATFQIWNYVLSANRPDVWFPCGWPQISGTPLPVRTGTSQQNTAAAAA